MSKAATSTLPVQKMEVAPPATLPASESAAVMSMIERAARDPSVDIVKMERLFEMAERVKNREAEAAFNTAMSAAQAAVKAVVRNRKNSQTKSNYADMAAIADAAMPTIYEHGFGVMTSEFESKRPDHLGVALDVTHSGGHSKRFEFNIPFDGAGMKGNANKTPTHAYGSTLQYGERYGKCKIFGIATKDDDGNAAGADATISEDQIADLKEQIKKYEADTAKLCDFMNVEALETIPAKQYEAALAYLDAKRRFKK